MRCVLTSVLLCAAPYAGVGATLGGAVAVPDFTYQDTSGEVQDQHAAHAARLRAFDDALRRDLRAGGSQVLPLACSRQAACGADPSAVAHEARAAGASLLALGGIHKMSTLVQFARVALLDVCHDTVLYDRLYTFRGDTQNSWQRAEAFIAQDMIAQHVSSTGCVLPQRGARPPALTKL